MVSRKQLTLFPTEWQEQIEYIRRHYNPLQYALISAHVTLCREDELNSLEKVINNINSMARLSSMRIEFNFPQRFDNGKGLLMPAKPSLIFNEMRKRILEGIESPKPILPHVTLMHPRNSTCSELIYNEIKLLDLPSFLTFDKISLIEQKNGEKWTILQQFSIT